MCSAQILARVPLSSVKGREHLVLGYDQAVLAAAGNLVFLTRISAAHPSLVCQYNIPLIAQQKLDIGVNKCELFHNIAFFINAINAQCTRFNR